MAVIETTEGEDAPALVPAPPDLVALDTAGFEETDGEDAGEPYSTNLTRSGFSQLMELLRIAIHNISYIRGIFPENYFRDSLVSGTDMTVKKLIPKDIESRRIIDWIEQGVYDAMEKKYLETLLFCICEKDEGSSIDEFSFTFKYPANTSGEESMMQFRLAGSRGNGAIFNSNPAESISDQIRRLIRVSATVITSLDQIPDERTIVMKLMYYDDVTPEYYEPPLFECCPDDEDGTDLAQIFGRLCYISQRAPTLLLDSGSTHHICCDKSYMKEIVPISEDKQIELITADDTSLTAVETGVIELGNIHLNQVRYIGEDRFNVVSIGYLDRQGLLVSIVNSQVFIIDVTKAVHVGEGYRHLKNNDYVLKAIKWNVKTEVMLQPEVLEDDDSESWVIDSCCASHMAGRLEMLTNQKPFQKEFYTPRGIMVSTHKGSVRTANVNLSDVLYCPANSNNLLSVGLLDSQGYRFTFYGGLCTIVYKDTLEEVGWGMLRDSDLLYYLQRLETKNMNVVHKRKRKTSRRNKFD